ncbi:hypothetical protein [Shewanella algidipiscicola]|uniref:Uncharacterized protein n=1 Tax=Shewanella algidipiscicola TaxID=614070 RepID=A0ABQ4PGA3_9GAMM|nr:hypothetical protein [Shewanella algidipiscicola]GIU46468.1 hypothetical protein TUM4630_17030 [Shewanella algidipiscicola]
MDLDSIPTIESLLEQDAIHFTGNAEWINRFIDLITPYGVLTHFIYGSPATRFDSPFKTLDPIDLCANTPLIDLNTNEKRFLTTEELNQYQSVRKIHKQVRPLYTVNIDKDFTVIAHVNSNSGNFDKLIHQKINVNPHRLIHSLKALARAIDQSNAFFICSTCNQLIDADFKSKGQPVTCDDNACNNMAKQHFDVSSAKVTNQAYNQDMRIDILEDGITISTAIVGWHGPYSSHLEWVTQQKMSLNSTPRQVKSAAKAIHESDSYRIKCIYCKEMTNIGNMFDDDTCHSCASSQYGILY